MTIQTLKHVLNEAEVQFVYFDTRLGKNRYKLFIHICT